MAEKRAREEEAASEPPAQGAATSGQQSVASAPADVMLPDAMGNMPERASSALADTTQVKEFGKDEKTGLAITAAATDPSKVETGPYGMAVSASGEVAGGNISKVLEVPPADEYLQRPLVKEQAAMLTPVYQKLAGIVGRPPNEWGLIGPGEVIKGHMLLLDLNTGEKVRAMDGHRVNKGELYANLRNLPESLATGDTISRVLGG